MWWGIGAYRWLCCMRGARIHDTTPLLNEACSHTPQRSNSSCTNTPRNGVPQYNASVSTDDHIEHGMSESSHCMTRPGCNTTQQMLLCVVALTPGCNTSPLLHWSVCVVHRDPLCCWQAQADLLLGSRVLSQLICLTATLLTNSHSQQL